LGRFFWATTPPVRRTLADSGYKKLHRRSVLFDTQNEAVNSYFERVVRDEESCILA
jgi:hypothetical protein